MSFLDLRRSRKDRAESVDSQVAPDLPRADTLGIVPIVGLTEDMLITENGTFVMMLELKPIDMGASGQDFSYWVRRYQSALEKLPPGTNFQLSVQLEPRDPVPDLEYFLGRAHHWHNIANQLEGHERITNQANEISQAAQAMTSYLAFWFDNYQPITWRTIYTLFHKAPIQFSKKSLLGFRKNGAEPKDVIATHMPQARDSLQRQAGIMSAAFGDAGMPMKALSPDEMCQVIWRGLHPAANGMPVDSAADIAVSMAQGKEPHRKKPPTPDVFWPGMPDDQLKSLLAPDTVLEREGWIEVDGVKATGYVIHDFRPHQPAMVHRLANLPGGWVGSVHIEFTDPALVANKLKQREVQLSATEMIKSSKGIIQSYANQQEVGAVQQQRMAMETVGQTPVFIRFFVMRTAHDEETLKERVRDLESLLTTIGVSAFPARYSQMPLWKSTIPVGEVAMNQKPRNMTPSSLGIFFWPTQSRYMDEQGIYMGIDETTQLPIRLDPFGRFQEKTPTFLAIGRPGAGKSVWLRTMILSVLMSGGNALAVDIEGEMQEFCDRYGGRYIEIGALTGERINVLDVPPDSGHPLEFGTKHLVAFCEAVRGTSISKGPEWNALAQAYRLVIEDRGLIDEGTGMPQGEWKTEDAPLLKDITRVLAQSRNSEARSLAEMLHPYSEGLYAQYFNTPTTFNIRDERLVIFGMRHVNESGTWSDQELQVYLWQVMSLLWGEALRRNQANPDVANHVMLDEVWALLRTPGGAAAIENMARRFRKRRAALWMATQQIGEFLEKEHGRQILSVVGTKFLMGVSPFEAQRMQNPFELSDFLVDLLTQLGHGRGLLQMPNAVLRVSVRVPKELGLY